MIEFREGYSDKALKMILETIPKIEKFKHAKLVDNPEKVLREKSWIVWGEENDRCVVALWGDGPSINIICDPCYKGKWATRRLIRQFFAFFFSRYAEAQAQADEYADLWQRVGFRNGRMKWGV